MERFVPYGQSARKPLVFGWYEVGRSSNPAVCGRPSSAFLDKRPQGAKLELTGDPGRYDPWAYDEMASLGYSRSRKAFDATQARDMTMTIGELGMAAPGPGYYVQHPRYSQGRAYPAADSQRSVFTSTSLQRPSSKSFVPSA